MVPRSEDSYKSCSRTYATLCLYHETVNPEEFSARLEIKPDRTVHKGQKLPLSIAVRNGWFFGTQNRVKSNDLAVHIKWLVDQLLTKHETFSEFQKKGCEIRIMCFWESAFGNGGPVLDHQLLQNLAEIRADLHFDVWFKQDV